MKKRWIALSILIGTIVLAFGSCAAFRLKWQHEFDRRVDEMAKQGHPVSLDDIEAAAALPDGVPNAADLYIKAFDAYVEPTEEQKALLPLRGTFERTANEPLPPEVFETIRVTLEANAQTLELLDAGVKIEHCRYPQVREGGIMTNKYLSETKDGGFLLIERSLYLAASDQNQAAVESCLKTMAFAESLERGGCLLDYLVMNAMFSRICDGLCIMISQAEFSDSDLQRLQSRVADLHRLDGFQKALVNDRTISIEFARKAFNERDHAGKDFWTVQFERFYRAAGFEAREINLLCDYLQRCIDAAALPITERYAEYAKLSVEMEDMWFYHVTSGAAYTALGNIDLRVAGSLRCAETALAIERYRLKHGRLPETLEAIVPEFMDAVPLDPIDGMPLRYVRNDVGYTVYTIGDDGVDNGGREQLMPGSHECDFPFTVTR